MKTRRTLVIPATEGKKLMPAQFKSFDRRPVNYFRDVIFDEDPTAVRQLNEQEFSGRIEAAVALERKQLLATHEVELRQRFDAGVAQGRQEAGGEMKRGMDLLQEYARMLQAEKQELAQRAEQQTVELAFMLAQKIIGAELEFKPERVTEVARLALQQVLDCDQIELKVNPEDFGYLKAVQQDFASQLSGHARLEIRADKSLARGSCMIETERGLLDARIQTQLESLKESIGGAGEGQG